MAKEESRNLVLKYIEEVWNAGNVRALEDLTVESFRYHLGGQPPRDRTAMAQFLEEVREAFPDWRVRIEEVVAEGTTVAVRWTGTVTHEGNFHGIPATGKQVSVSGINLYLIEGGKISQEWEQMDSLGMLQQLGALPLK